MSDPPLYTALFKEAGQWHIKHPRFSMGSMCGIRLKRCTDQASFVGGNREWLRPGLCQPCVDGPQGEWEIHFVSKPDLEAVMGINATINELETMRARPSKQR